MACSEPPRLPRLVHGLTAGVVVDCIRGARLLAWRSADQAVLLAATGPDNRAEDAGRGSD